MNRQEEKSHSNIFWACSLLYCGAYISRLNISVALPAIREAFALSQGELGIIVAGFSICYATGQLINGMVVDHVDARKYIAIGAMASAGLNALISISQSFALIVALWCLNGLAQSMLWTPVIRILSMYSSGEKRKRATFYLSFASNIGHILAWFIAGQMVRAGTWRMSFLIPGAITAALGLVSLLMIPRDYRKTAPNLVSSETKPQPAGKMAKLVLTSGLVFVLFCTSAKGFVRDGVTSWGPSILLALGGESLGSSLNFALLIPLINMLGLVLGRGVFVRFKGNAMVIIVGFMLLCSGLSLLLFFLGASSALVCAILLSLLCAGLSSVGPLISTYIPMFFDKVGRVGTVTGLVDCFQYVGSAFSGAITGVVVAEFAWKGVFAAWVVMCAVSAGMALGAKGRLERFVGE